MQADPSDGIVIALLPYNLNVSNEPILEGKWR